jgi:hypothetical protein
MHAIKKYRTILTLAIIMVSGIARAAGPDTQLNLNPEANSVSQAINSCPGGIAFGIYSFNYEYLFDNYNGVVARFDYESQADSYKSGSIDATGMAFIINYRRHLSGELESLFIGSYLRYRVYSGDGNTGDTRFDFTMPEYTLGINVGKRWVWNNGFNITFALGYGISTSEVNSSVNSAAVKNTIDALKDEYAFLSPFMGEFSLGYAF